MASLSGWTATPSQLDELQRVLQAVETDLLFRTRVVEAKCAELERIRGYLGRLGDEQARAHAAAVKLAEAADRQTQQLQSSLEQAIDRARKIRIELANKHSLEEDDEEDVAAGVDTPRSLQGILAMARAIRDGAPSSDDHASKNIVPSESDKEVVGRRRRFQLPRALKRLMEQLANEEELLRQPQQSFRVQFCRRMTEHLSVINTQAAASVAVDEGGDDDRRRTPSVEPPPAPLRVQVGYPKQITRLQNAHDRLTAYLEHKLAVDGEAMQKARETPSVATTFPVYCRLKKATKVFRDLKAQTSAAMGRIPPPRKMSPAAIAYRDATLAKIKRKPSSQDANSSFTTVSMRDRSIDNATLQFRWRGRPQEDLHTWRQLENAWKASTDDKTHTADLNVYKRCVDNLVLTATSNVVLSAFQEVFCQERSRLDADQIREMMLLVRLVDSMALKQGRKVASVIQPH